MYSRKLFFQQSKRADNFFSYPGKLYKLFRALFREKFPIPVGIHIPIVFVRKAGAVYAPFSYIIFKKIYIVGIDPRKIRFYIGYDEIAQKSALRDIQSGHDILYKRALFYIRP